ncbi:hypothetical protein, partial [Aliikangiella maris]
SQTTEQQVDAFYDELGDTLVNAGELAIGNLPTDLANLVPDWLERFTHSEPGEFGRLDPLVDPINEVAVEASKDIRVAVGGVLILTPVKLGKVPLSVQAIAENPGVIWGRSVSEILKVFKSEGFGVSIKQSTRGSGNATLIKIQGHKTIQQIQVHAGGGRHGGSYYKVSTTSQGKIWVVNPKTFRVLDGQKGAIINGPPQ